jgi:hypothetical protein
MELFPLKKVPKKYYILSYHNALYNVCARRALNMVYEIVVEMYSK